MESSEKVTREKVYVAIKPRIHRKSRRIFAEDSLPFWFCSDEAAHSSNSPGSAAMKPRIHRTSNLAWQDSLRRDLNLRVSLTDQRNNLGPHVAMKPPHSSKKPSTLAQQIRYRDPQAGMPMPRLADSLHHQILSRSPEYRSNTRQK